MRTNLVSRGTWVINFIVGRWWQKKNYDNKIDDGSTFLSSYTIIINKKQIVFYDG